MAAPVQDTLKPGPPHGRAYARLTTLDSIWPSLVAHQQTSWMTACPAAAMRMLSMQQQTILVTWSAATQQLCRVTNSCSCMASTNRPPLATAAARDPGSGSWQHAANGEFWVVHMPSNIDGCMQQLLSECTAGRSLPHAQQWSAHGVQICQGRQLQRALLSPACWYHPSQFSFSFSFNATAGSHRCCVAGQPGGRSEA